MDGTPRSVTSCLGVNAGRKPRTSWRTKIAHVLTSIPNHRLHARPRRSHRLGRPFHVRLQCPVQRTVLAHAIAVAADVHQVAVMQHPIDERCGHDIVTRCSARAMSSRSPDGTAARSTAGCVPALFRQSAPAGDPAGFGRISSGGSLGQMNRTDPRRCLGRNEQVSGFSSAAA